MLDNGLKGGFISAPDNTSPKQWIEKRKLAMQSLVTQETVEGVVNFKNEIVNIAFERGWVKTAEQRNIEAQEEMESKQP